MILSASRRTDIPAYYSDWFYKRIKEGFLYVRNPVNMRQVSEIDISPLLCGTIRKEDKVTVRSVRSLRDDQLSFGDIS